jgi:hypothetical protein
MRSVHGLCFSGLLVAGLLTASSASAQVFEGTAGLKGFAGGNVWTTPTDIPGSYDGHGFAGSGGGFGWGVGAWVEARFIKFIGLELGLTYDKSTIFRDVSTNFASLGGARADTREKLDMTSLRVPLLAKGILPIPFGRIYFGIGPEFIVPQSAEGGVEQTGGQVQITNLASMMRVNEKSSTMLTIAPGVAIELPAKLDLTLELRASKNMSQDPEWSKRVTWASSTYDLPYTVNAQSTWDFRLGIGLGYRF